MVIKMYEAHILFLSTGWRHDVTGTGVGTIYHCLCAVYYVQYYYVIMLL